MKTKTKAVLISILALVCWAGLAVAKGDLELHFIDVGQGDSALIVSPGGETVLVDAADRPDAYRVAAYLDQLGLTNIEYFIASHYDSDHIGGVERVLSQFPVERVSYDRGTEAVPPLFTNYVETVGAKRKTALEGSSLTLDANSTQPVTINFIARNGHGVENVKNENDRCLVFVLHYGQFDAEFGGDLSGQNTSNYRDVETVVAPEIGQVEVYKVHHHGSKNNSNTNLLSKIKPKVAVISCGTGNRFKHPNKEVIQRLRSVGATNYWTETGNGEPPVSGVDKVGGTIIVHVPPQSTTFTVTYAGDQTNTYEVWNPLPTASYAWSVKSFLYHNTNCPYVKSITPDNLQTGPVPPTGKKPHQACVGK